ncbi:hypothetical protein EVAR_33391_1 [Eumeta japonica]|uniref:Uncharacterized protein n=1 Tax=Eumeta variegata TaxID=151549 RepID=A0A4C1X058_EUMVA|nr:hypothetical protein EVAR_33391_1 [Eumeta japonica]
MKMPLTFASPGRNNWRRGPPSCAGAALERDVGARAPAPAENRQCKSLKPKFPVYRLEITSFTRSGRSATATDAPNPLQYINAHPPAHMNFIYYIRGGVAMHITYLTDTGPAGARRPPAAGAQYAAFRISIFMKIFTAPSLQRPLDTELYFASPSL